MVLAYLICDYHLVDLIISIKVKFRLNISSSNTMIVIETVNFNSRRTISTLTHYCDRNGQQKHQKVRPIFPAYFYQVQTD